MPAKKKSVSRVKGSSNVPNVSQQEAAKWTTRPHRYDGRLAKQGQFHGAMQFKTKLEATNYRYGLRGYIEWAPGMGYQTGYATKTEPHTGCVWIMADGKSVTWGVCP